MANKTAVTVHAGSINTKVFRVVTPTVFRVVTKVSEKYAVSVFFSEDIRTTL
jgi:hypothetical protein